MSINNSIVRNVSRVRLGFGILLLAQAGCSEEAKPVELPAAETSSIVATVNGLPIDQQELEHELAAGRAGVYQYFWEHHHASSGPEFWSGHFGGENPLDVAKQRALATLVDRKVREGLMKEHGVLNDVSYSGFVQRQRIHNDQNAVTDVSYGVPEMTEDQYMRYELTSAEGRLKDLIVREMPPPTEEQLAADYDAIKDRLFTAKTTVTASVISFDYGVGSLANDQQAKNAAKVEAMLQAKQTIEPFLTQCRCAHIDARTFETSVSHEDRVHAVPSYIRSNPLLSVAMATSPNGVSAVADTGTSYSIVEGRTRSTEYRSLAEVRGGVVAYHFDHAYTELVAQRVTDAKVEINRDALAAVTSRGL